MIQKLCLHILKRLYDIRVYILEVNFIYLLVIGYMVTNLGGLAFQG